MATENYLAIDLGAGSGRAILGSLDGDRIALKELHRFANPGVRVLDTLRWDVLALFDEIKSGLRNAAKYKPASVGVDTWGVDFALLDRTGDLVSNPYHYRDGRTNGVMAKTLERISREEIFDQTGLQFMEINSLFQLVSMQGTPALDAADSLLLMPDLFHYWLTGEKACEFTDASTTQFHDPRKRDWARPLLEKLGLPTGILETVVQPGTQLGPLRASVAAECGVPGMTVVAPPSHDTASAVVAVPAENSDWAFLSSGTWSLLGAETQQPYVTPAALAKNFTNEGGYAGTTRLLKNICGMWLLEECRREWSVTGADVDYEDIIGAAAVADPFRSIVDVNDPVFVAPGAMPQRIADWSARSGQPRPETPAQFARAIFESLALKYRATLEDLAAITGRPARTLHIVGGGSRNDLLNQYAADACGIPVIAGPVEATAVGNVLVQAISLGRLGGLEQAREVVRRSFQPKRYEPRKTERWVAAADRLRDLHA